MPRFQETTGRPAPGGAGNCVTSHELPAPAAGPMPRLQESTGRPTPPRGAGNCASSHTPPARGM
jgi:hypothetical protein